MPQKMPEYGLVAGSVNVGHAGYRTKFGTVVSSVWLGGLVLGVAGTATALVTGTTAPWRDGGDKINRAVPAVTLATSSLVGYFLVQYLRRPRK